MRILIVEDDQEIRNFLKTAFESECFVVDAEEDGEKGSFTARTNEYDLIILDIGLPTKDGLSICKEIRSEQIDTPIIILSVKTETPTKIKLIEAGADDYLTKPFSFGELLARARALLRRPKVIRKHLIQAGPFTIDTDKHELRYEDKNIRLTRKEYILLEYLAQNPGKVVSRGAILEHAWDMNADPFSNTIETHIRNIRKKISEACGQNIIHTLSGRGYMFEIRP